MLSTHYSSDHPCEVQLGYEDCVALHSDPQEEERISKETMAAGTLSSEFGPMAAVAGTQELKQQVCCTCQDA